MKIPGQIPKISEIYNKNKTVSNVNKTSGVSAKKDVVSISNQGKDFQAVLKSVKETPDVREDKVNEIRERVQKDTYEPSGADIADRVIKSIFDKKF